MLSEKLAHVEEAPPATVYVAATQSGQLYYAGRLDEAVAMAEADTSGGCVLFNPNPVDIVKAYVVAANILASWSVTGHMEKYLAEHRQPPLNPFQKTWYRVGVLAEVRHVLAKTPVPGAKPIAFLGGWTLYRLDCPIKLPSTTRPVSPEEWLRDYYALLSVAAAVRKTKLMVRQYEDYLRRSGVEEFSLTGAGIGFGLEDALARSVDA